MELKMLSVPSLEAFGPDGPPMTRNVLAQTSGTRQRSSWPSAVPTTRGGTGRLRTVSLPGSELKDGRVRKFL